MRRGAFIAALALGGALASPALARESKRTTVAPYIEVGQVLTADLNGGGDVLTYSTAAVGVDAQVDSRRVQAQVSYRYERRFSWQKKVGDDDVHSGLARAAVKVAPGVSVEAGALATRVRADIRGAAPGNLVGNVDNVSQIYSVYAGPSVATKVGPATLTAAYRYGYTRAEATQRTGLAAGQPAIDQFSDAQTQVAQATLGVKSGVILPVGITASVGWERDSAGQLDQRYEGKFARGDVVLPVLPTLALTAGAGYENIKVSERDALVDGNGVPVLDSKGRYVTDPASPRRIAYQTDGLIYDAGVIWRPSPRTELQAHVGKRYGSTSYTGQLSYSPNRQMSLQAGVYDSVETFGRQVQGGIAGLPVSFLDQRDAFSQQYSGCVFGGSGGAAGGCLTGVFQSLAASSYRARGVDAILTARRRGVTFGVGGGYANRRFYAPGNAAGPVVDGVTDQSYYVQAFASVPIDRNSGVSGGLFGNYYDPGVAGAGNVFSTGATASYYRNFGRLGAAATLGLYQFKVEKGGADDASAQATLGMRYQF